MSERKVLNKYYPVDFDPSKIPRAKRPKNRQWTIRTMAPFNMRCNMCGEYIYKGKKFNARQEPVENENYLGLRIWRFYIKCPKCVSEITFKTDPENTDYALEFGASRNFEALRTAEILAQKEADEKEEEEKNNPMKMLENRTRQSQREMDMLETLEDLREINAKKAKVNLDEVIGKHQIDETLVQEKLKQLQEEEDEAFVRSAFQREKRILEDDDDDKVTDVKKQKASTSFQLLIHVPPPVIGKKEQISSLRSKMGIKPKQSDNCKTLTSEESSSRSSELKKEKPLSDAVPSTSGFNSLCAAYGSSEEEED